MEHLFGKPWDSTHNMFCRTKIVEYRATKNQ